MATAVTSGKRNPKQITPWCIHISVHIPLIGLSGHNIKSTLSTAVSGQNELRAQVNLTRDQEEKKYHT